MRDAADPLAALAVQLDDGAAFIPALSGPFRRAVRIHPRRGTPTGWGELAPVPWSPLGRFHAPDIDPGGRLDHHTGCCYAQDAASQLPVALLAPLPGETIIDACAAPGSKSTQIGIALGDDGLLVCVDLAPPRRRVLAENLARQGVACALVTPMPLHGLAERHAGCADGVLVDAPCSGHEARSSRQVARMGERQSALLACAARLVRPGGRLVYSTCTPYRAEDEDVIARFVADHPGWTVEVAAPPGCSGDLDGAGGVRLWPHRQGCEPFFACRLRAPGDEPATRLAGREPPTDRELDALIAIPGLRAWRRGDLAFIGSRQAASCALPSEARGLIAGHLSPDWQPDPWGAQALIERGAPAVAVTHAEALTLWAGTSLPLGLPAGTLLRTEAGAPLGVSALDGALTRLAMPSRLRRSGLV